jgi:F-type H+-transporting ATPase subunit gamma
MSGNMQSLRRKIDSAGDLEGVVRAMKALAASSIGQYEKAVQSLDGYYRTVEPGLAACLRQARPTEAKASGFPKSGAPVGAVIFGSDQGLVGQFNEVIVDLAVDTLHKLPAGQKKIWAVGDRVHGLLVDAGLTAPSLLLVPTSVSVITPLVGDLLIDIEAAREQHKVEEVYLFHNRPKGGASYEPVFRRLLPLDRDWQQSLIDLPWPTKMLPEVIEGPSPTLEAFTRGYLFVLLFQACAESLNSENASRLAAMQRAEKNIKNMLGQLNQEFHRVRQESIDEELFDVVSGFEALTGKSGTHLRT